MKKYHLMAVSLVIPCMMALVSFTNVIGYYIVKTSNQNILTNEIEQKDLLYQTILDIANKKEIREVVLKSELSGNPGRPFFLRLSLSMTAPRILTKNFLNYASIMGGIFSRTYKTSRVLLILERHQTNQQRIQKEINAFIENDLTLKTKIAQLSNLQCDCGNKTTTPWTFYILCAILYPIFIFVGSIWVSTHGLIFDNLVQILEYLGYILHC